MSSRFEEIYRTWSDVKLKRALIVEREMFIPEAISALELEAKRRESLPKPVVPQTVGVRKCVPCGNPLRTRGIKSFHQGTRYGFFGDLAELLVQKEKMEMFTCEKCGWVTFYVINETQDE